MKKMSEKDMRKSEGGAYIWSCGYCHKTGKVWTPLGALAATVGHKSHGGFSINQV